MELETITHKPKPPARPTPLLFVHGMWHAAWCWAEHFLPYFAQHGYHSCALSLRGHGTSPGRERLRFTSLADYVADVAQTANQMDAPPALVGHSMGGMIVQKYLESRRAAAGVLLASAPPHGVIPATWRVLRRHPLTVLKANLTLSMLPIIGTPKLAQEALFSATMPAEQVTAYLARLQDESYRAYLDMLFLNLPRPQKITAPIHVLGAADDAIFPVQEIAATAQAYHTTPVIFDHMAHDMMLESGWQAVADEILSWLDEKGL